MATLLLPTPEALGPLPTVPRDVLRRAAYGLAHALAARGEDVRAELAHLAAIREELARRDAVATVHSPRCHCRSPRAEVFA